MSFAVFQGIGATELLIVLGVVLVIFGPKRLPMLGRQLGSGMREFKDSITRRHGDEDPDALERPAASGDEPEVTGEVVGDRERSA